MKIHPYFLGGLQTEILKTEFYVKRTEVSVLPLRPGFDDPVQWVSRLCSRLTLVVLELSPEDPRQTKGNNGMTPITVSET